MTGTGVAAGSVQQRAGATALYARFGLSASEPPVVLNCRGYVVWKGRYTASQSTSPDRRLAGATTLVATLALRAGTSSGFVTGRLTVRDGRGRLTMSAELNAAVSQDIEAVGMLTGKVMRPNARLRAPISMLFLPGGYTFVSGGYGFSLGPRSAVVKSRLRGCRPRAGARR